MLSVEVDKKDFIDFHRSYKYGRLYEIKDILKKGGTDGIFRVVKKQINK
jgi:hypothetical protein